MRVIHVVAPDGERERLVSLNGSAREVLRDKDTVTCIMPDARLVWVDPRGPQRAFPKIMTEELTRLANFYDFRLGGTDRVAGRLVQEIAILPKDDYRYGYRLWLDLETALPLKSDLIDESGTAVEQMMFTHLSLPGKIDAALLEPETTGEAFSWQMETGAPEVADSDALEWKSSRIPAGYSIKSTRLRALRDSPEPVQHTVFSDGLSSFSLYVERAGDADGLRGPSRMGAVNAWGNRVGDVQITVVGEVPRATTKLVAMSVARTVK